MSPSKFSVLMTWVLSVITQAQDGILISGPSYLQTTPLQPLIISGRPLFINCGMPNVPPNGKVVALTIGRVLIPNVGAEPETVAKESPSIANGVASRVPQTPERAIVRGTLKEKFLRLCFPTANCEDSGTYTCNARVSTNGVITYYRNAKTVVIPGNPGNITMDVPETDCCIVGQTITLTCGQFVGPRHNTSQHNWVWEFKDKNAADWQSYVTGNPTADFTQRQPAPSTNPCYTHSYSSSLSRRLTLEDSERQYRCYVNGSVTDQGVYKAKVHPVGTVKETSKSSQASATNWLAVGLGVAGAVACLGVGLGVALHSKRKRSGQQPSMTPAATLAPPPSLAGGNTETAMNTGDPAHVGQSGQTNMTL
ncbi:uncharacterized protein [Littorina saxatilis]|uniref:Ig-like domain-containing protein n=1 Tax=Littorina saxatilis TaxID=31220 RepID=A0AAN9GH67_9CAEN